MVKFEYRAEVQTSGGLTAIVGQKDIGEGPFHLELELPEGIIKKITGKLHFPVHNAEKSFLNGFQTWTYCREYRRSDKLRGLNGLPPQLIEKYHFDRYGDYHFVDYPYTAGVFHGESYGYVRDGDFYRLFASLNEEPGYTIFRLDTNMGLLRIERDCEGVRCGGAYRAFDLFFASGSEKEVFDGWFEAMGVKPITAEPIKGYSSWYNRYEDISEASIMADLEGCAGVMEPGDLFQVDDGWEKHVGDWLFVDEQKFPNGLKTVVDAIHGKGFKAGLWLAPFVAKVGSDIELYHPDWLLKVDGKPWFDGINWGGFYSLDIDNPEVEDYIRRTFRRVFDEWGFDLVKLDFLYGAAPFGNERESRAGRMIRAMRLLREVCGDHAILGCGVPVMTAFGLVEYCRVSCDVSLDWDDKAYMKITHRERVSTKHAMETSIFRRQLNGRAFLSDPDVFFLRDDNISLTEKQKLNLAQLDRLIGGVYLCSDNIGLYSEEKKQLYKSLCSFRPESEPVFVLDDGVRIHYKQDGAARMIDIYEK